VTVCRASTDGGPIQLSNNSAAKNLNCTGNVPAPTGSGNTGVSAKLGQYAGL
jgi:hypothetical protein